MTDREQERNEALRRNVVEKMWLNYFNNELLAQGLITESIHHKMKVYQHRQNCPRSQV